MFTPAVLPSIRSAVRRKTTVGYTFGIYQLIVQLEGLIKWSKPNYKSLAKTFSPQRIDIPSLFAHVV